MLRTVPMESSEPVWEVVNGVFSRGDTAKSALLNGFEVVVNEVWAAAHL